MPTETLDSRLEAALNRRADLAAEVQRITGKLEAARKNLEEVEAACREKGVEPDKLDETIEKLTERYESDIEKLEQEVDAASQALAPYLKES